MRRDVARVAAKAKVEPKVLTVLSCVVSEIEEKGGKESTETMWGLGAENPEILNVGLMGMNKLYYYL